MRASALAALLASILSTASLQAIAQGTQGFAVDRFEPAERGSRFFVVDTLDLEQRAAVGVVAEYASKPLSAYGPTESETRAPVRHQLFLHAGASLVLARRLRLAFDLPVAAYQDGEPVRFAGAQLGAATKPALGDLRLAADARLLGRSGDRLIVAAGLRAWLPTGVRSQFTSDGAVRLGPQVLASGDLGPIVWGARLGAVQRWRDDTFAGSDLGAELVGGAGLGLQLFRSKLVVGPEVFASTGLRTSAAFFGERSTPVEALLGAHADIGAGWRLGAAIGSGFGRGYGAPAARAVLAVEWAPSSAPPDRDKDGILDAVDACPDEAGAADPDPTVHGCPAAIPMPMPIEDTDGDGVFDPDDACPTARGVPSADRHVNGCPPLPDRPLAVMTDTEIRIEEQVRFETDSAALHGDSVVVLLAIKRVLDEHPELRKVRVEGHTDAVGDPTYNDELSAKRASAVTGWLIGHGIDAARLVSAGLGSREPIDTNDTEAGRTKNRRVVLKILERQPGRQSDH